MSGTTEGLARAFNRAYKAKLLGVDVAYLQLKFPTCAYCDRHSSTRLHFEHITARSKGGTHALSNLVLACDSCNGLKCNREWRTWFRAQDFHDDIREKVIGAHVATGAEHCTDEDFLAAHISYQTLPSGRPRKT